MAARKGFTRCLSNKFLEEKKTKLAALGICRTEIGCEINAECLGSNVRSAAVDLQYPRQKIVGRLLRISVACACRKGVLEIVGIWGIGVWRGRFFRIVALLLGPRVPLCREDCRSAFPRQEGCRLGASQPTYQGDQLHWELGSGH